MIEFENYLEISHPALLIELYLNVETKRPLAAREFLVLGSKQKKVNRVQKFCKYSRKKLNYLVQVWRIFIFSFPPMANVT